MLQQSIRRLSISASFFAIQLSIATIALAAEQDATKEDTVSFSRDIRPILADRCFACHGPDTESRQADLRLDQASGPEGAYASAIQPGAVDDSELWLRITSDDDDVRMPPPDAHVPPLSRAEQQLFKTWINAGARYEQFWAFRPIQQPALPKVKSVEWSNQPIDLFVQRKLESLALSKSDEADLRTLLRRLTFDLTGLPPTQAEIRTFLKDAKGQANQTVEGDARTTTNQTEAFEKAWESAIDRLLARPQYGEHMARFWLDLVRFADTNGMHKDFYRNNIAYRDWVIRAFNDNLGYDDFVRFQLAGDLFDEPTNDQLIASGFHRLHLIIDRGTALPEESFTKNVIDRLTSVGTAFMGLTVHCAQCHDHKYDPITQKDFYALYAFLNNIDGEPETRGRPDRGFQPPFISLATEEQKQELGRFDERLAKVDKSIKDAKAFLQESKAAAKAPSESNDASQSQSSDNQTDTVEVSGGTQNETASADTEEPESKVNRFESQENTIKELEQQRKRLQQQRMDFDRTLPYAMVMKERDEVRPTHILIRGEYDAPGDAVERDTPGFLPPLKKKGDVATRMDLANWFADSANPLTARVAVNRFWQQFFGVGLVKTSEDLGAQGDVPSHPELFEYLSATFVESGYDVKSLVKQIVMSKTYRQSSLATPEQFKADPDNRNLARGTRYRLDAEMIRDQILATSGLLSERVFGPSVKPPQPDGLWKAVTMTGQRFQADSGEAIYRRSLYTFWKRAMPPPQMTILNAPTRAACIARRERTNTPSQALLLLNETEYLSAARELARRTLEQEGDPIEFIWESVTSRLPDTTERATLETLLGDLLIKYQAEPALAKELCGKVETTDEEQPKLAAWTMIASTIYNLDITKTRD